MDNEEASNPVSFSVGPISGSPHDHAATINPAKVDWQLVRRSSVHLYQHFKYEYPAPIKDLRHKLVLIPPATFGEQRRTQYHLTVSLPCEVTATADAFSNTIVEVKVPLVDHTIEFEARVAVERGGLPEPRRLPASWLDDPRLLLPTPRTTPDDALNAAAVELASHGLSGLELAERTNQWVHDAISYAFGSTDVRTTAAEALAAGSGVCQDYAHIMLTLCRLLGLPSLYVSGHLLGEGGTHAWVEVLLPARDGSGEAEAWALDPTHARRVGATYVSVAVGRDYGDVAPTSGSFRARHTGRLSTRKQVRLTEVAYQD